MKQAFFSVIISVYIHWGVSEDENHKTDYCEDKWKCGLFKHFMCEFKLNKKTEKCSMIVTEISHKERMETLKLVNQFRNHLAGGDDPAFPDGANNIRQVTWDYELEKFAEVYGSQCGSSKVPDLDPCAKTQKFQQGTRPLWGITEDDDRIDDVIVGPQGWTSDIPEAEVIQKFEPVDGDDRLEPNYGRFTMLAWAKTYKMGCSIIKCNCSPRLADSRKLVCFFGPSGNIGGEPVFLTGKACTACPAGSTCNKRSVWSKLCATRDDPDNVHVLSPATSIHSTFMDHITVLSATLLLAKLQQSYC